MMKRNKAFLFFFLLFTILLSFSHQAFALTTDYEYDDQYRLTKVSRSDGTAIQYQYDEAGNRTRMLVNMSASVQYQLTVSKNGTGSGAVTSSPAGINCGATCNALFNEGQTVTLTAAATGGSAFTGWSGGGCSGTGTCVVTIDAAKNVAAAFNLLPVVPTPPTTGTIGSDITITGSNFGATQGSGYVDFNGVRGIIVSWSNAQIVVKVPDEAKSGCMKVVTDYGTSNCINFTVSGMSRLPDTGQTKCYNNTDEIACPSPGEAFYGQDAQYNINPRSYTKLDASGNPLPDDAASWTMVKDNVTGLVWEMKTTDGSLHDKDKKFTWCDTNPATNGGDQGACGVGTGDAATDTEAFINALNAANYGGHNDWRMPTVKELSSLVNSSISYPGPTIDAAWFPNTVSSYYWSSTVHANNTSSAWLVYFYFGNIGGFNKSNSVFVRAVRGGQQSSSLTDNGDGTATDSVTGLMWQKATAPGTYTWEAALFYCENLTLAGHTDWRLPDLNELQSLVDYSRYYPAIDPLLAEDTVSSHYWSSTTYAHSTGGAWVVSFGSVGIDGNRKSNSYYARAVRGGQFAQTLNTIAVTPATASIPRGTTRQFTAVATYSNGSSIDVTAASIWTSGTVGVATVNSATGLARGVAIGASVITATYGGMSGSGTLNVNAATLISIAVTPATASIPMGTTKTFVATGTYSDGTTLDISNVVTWTSGTIGVATIVSPGVATGVSVGAATITATLSGKSGSGTLTVTAAAQQPLYASFTNAGIWQWTGSAWTQLTPDNPESIVAAGTNLYGKFGNGIWQWTGSGWTHLTPDRPAGMVASSTNLYGNFTGNGIWQWNGSGWTQLTPDNPETMVAAGANLYGKFANGIWQWTGSGWNKLTPDRPAEMVAAGSNLYGNFTGNGIWQWSGTNWTQLTPDNPESMVAGGTNLYGKFGNGVWQWTGSGWTKLTPDSPASMAAAGTILYGTFTGNGVWQWNGTNWTQLTPDNPAMMAVGE